MEWIVNGAITIEQQQQQQKEHFFNVFVQFFSSLFQF